MTDFNQKTHDTDVGSHGGQSRQMMLLSLPDTWNHSVRGLSSITPDGVDGVLTAL